MSRRLSQGLLAVTFSLVLLSCGQTVNAVQAFDTPSGSGLPAPAPIVPTPTPSPAPVPNPTPPAGPTAPASPDPAFGQDGRVVLRETGSSLAALVRQQKDGRLVVRATRAVSEGVYEPLLYRLNTGGTLDTTFGVGGRVTFAPAAIRTVSALLPLPDGRLLVGSSFLERIGSAEGVVQIVERFTSSGALDPTFGQGGRVILPVDGFTSDLQSLALQPDGQVLVGAGFSTFRLQPGGALDPSFGEGGRVADILSLGLPDGGFLSLGTTTDGSTLRRHLPDGRLDSSFGEGGALSFPQLAQYGAVREESVVARDGRIYVSLSTASPAASGPPVDLTFRWWVLGLGSNGERLASFGKDGVVEYTGRTPTLVGVQRDGRVVLQDGRLDVSGDVDPGFRPSFSPERRLSGAILQDDDRLVRFGSLVQGNEGAEAALLERLLP
ncbi:delta-60 repeat domain-containing protein [Deinococcus pimensis]|uniref:delta-60 repeat domain-containing protein n=1 Tax=Deinococcus pimensis TaxID=309888 RepID=UPI000489696A|nr:delta-60 repeat domain-containing protein [Deinococcus pimensis]